MVKRTLITASGSKGVPGLIRDLRISREELYIVCVDINPHAIGNIFADKSFVVPRWDSPAYIPAIKKIIMNEGISYVIPNDGPAGLLKFCELANQSENLKVAVTRNKKHLMIVLKKASFFDFLGSCGLEKYIPDYALVSEAGALLRAVKRFGYPGKKVVIKPANQEGSRGFKIIRDGKRNIFTERGENNILSLGELKFYLKGMKIIPKTLVTEYLSGDEYSVDVLVNPQGGKIEYIISRVREETSEGISIRGIIRKNSEIENIVKEVLKKLDLTYALNFQIKYNDEGVPKIIDINPRVAGAMTFSNGAGINMHYLLLRLLSGESIPRIKVKYD